MVSDSARCIPHRLKQLLDDQLPEQSQADLAEHLETCRACRRKLESLAADAPWWSDAARFLQPEDRRQLSSLRPGRDQVEPVGRADGAGLCAGPEPSLSFLAPSDDPEKLGRLGPYEIVELIGCGGMGVVLKGFDASLNRYVAVKVISPHLAGSAAARRRFAREAQAAAAVIHENVVPIHAVDSAGGLPYLVMPFIRGKSLEARIRETGPLGLKEILRIGMQTAAGLAAAHAQGLVHRDVKPANILLENGVERVLLTDFGLARAVDDAALTRSGVLAGTPQYMAPEQAKGETVDHRADLFSLGSVLYAMCTGHSPFRAETTMGVLRRICESRPRSIQDVNPEVPDWLAEIIDKLHEKHPNDRFRSATEVAELLSRHLAHVQHPSAAPMPDRLKAPSPVKRRVRWSPKHVVIATALLLLTIGLGATEMLRITNMARFVAGIFAESKSDQSAESTAEQNAQVAPTEAISEAALWEKVVQARQETKWAEAEATLKKFIAQFPESERIAEAYSRLSEVQVQQFKHQEGLETVELILKKHFDALDASRKAAVLWRAALCCRGLSRFDDSLEYLDRVITDFPDWNVLYLPYYLAGECRRAKGEWDEALEQYRLSAHSEGGGARNPRHRPMIEEKIKEIMAAHPESIEKAKAFLDEIKNLPPGFIKTPAPPSEKRMPAAVEARFAFASPWGLAQAAGDWLVSKAVAEDNGYQWEIQEGSGEYGWDLYVGAAGVCRYLAELAAAFQERRPYDQNQYALAANEGFRRLVAQSIKEGDAAYWAKVEAEATQPAAGFYTGTAGVGQAFLEAYLALQKDEYLAQAESAARWLISDKERWGKQTDIMFGAAGIGLFFLDLHEATKKPEYLDAARFAGDQLIEQATTEQGGYRWMAGGGYTGFAHGTAGIGYFLARLYEATEEKKYLDAADRAAQWLRAVAVEDQGGWKWWRSESQKDIFMTGWCHGPAGTGKLFLELYAATGDRGYLEGAEKGAAWLLSLGTWEDTTLRIPNAESQGRDDTCQCHGAAGIGEFFLDLYEATGQRKYLDNAQGMARWLESVAIHEGDGAKWVSGIRCNTGHGVGAAGIGRYFLRLHRVWRQLAVSRIPADKGIPAQALPTSPKWGAVPFVTDKELGELGFAKAEQGLAVVYCPHDIAGLGQEVAKRLAQGLDLAYDMVRTPLSLHRVIILPGDAASCPPLEDARSWANIEAEGALIVRPARSSQPLSDYPEHELFCVLPHEAIHHGAIPNLKLKFEHPEPRWFTEGVSELVAWQVEGQLSPGSRRQHVHLRIQALKRCQKEHLDIVDSRTWYAEEGGSSPDSSAGYACSLYVFVQLAERHGPDLINRVFDALRAGAAPSLSTQDLLPVMSHVTGEPVEPLLRHVPVNEAIKFFEDRLAEQTPNEQPLSRGCKLPMPDNKGQNSSRRIG